MNGYMCQGFNPLMSVPNRAKIAGALAKLKFLVVMDPLQTETARFWENHGEFNDVDPASIQTEVFELPTSCFAEDEGSLTNSSRWLQWHWPGAEPPGEAEDDIWIMAQLYLRLKQLYEAEGGAFPEPIRNLVWPYSLPDNPTADEIAREINGSALEDVPDPTDPTKILVAAGKQVDGFAQLTDDGKTACGCWIYSGCYTEAGNMMARRDTSDPADAGLAPKWSWSWPVNRRILYNRASADPEGPAVGPARKRLIEWNGSRWVGLDVPDYGPTVPPEKSVGPFIMNPEGVARLFTRAMMRDGPFPDALRALRVADRQPAGAGRPRQPGGPGVQGRHGGVRHRRRLPLRRHELPADRALPLLDQARAHQRRAPARAVRRDLGAARGGEGDRARRLGQGLEQPRRIKAKAVVTKRIRPLMCDGKEVHIVGIPLHWGFTGAARKGFGVNT